jgi:hypothetical protein
VMRVFLMFAFRLVASEQGKAQDNPALRSHRLSLKSCWEPPFWKARTIYKRLIIVVV